MQNTEIVKTFYETVISNNELDKIKDFISVNCQLRIGEKMSPLGVMGMQEHLKATKKTYPDYTMKILRQYTDGDYVISEFIMTGTHEGEWIGIKPTHKRLSFSGVNIDKVIDNKIVIHGGALNTFETLLEADLIGAK